MIFEILSAFDSARPHRRIFQCDATGRFVKIYTRRMDFGFGPVAWEMTGSECNSDGDALPISGGFKVLSGPDGEPMRHLVQVALESDVRADALLDTERQAFAQRVIFAAVRFDEAAAAL